MKNLLESAVLMSAQAGLTAVAVAAAFTSVENVKFYKIAHRGGTNLAMNEAYRRFWTWSMYLADLEFDHRS